MKRRSFIQKGALSGSFFALGGTEMLAFNSFEPNRRDGINHFKLNYAPHLGMFKNLAGDDPIDQLNFMADQGFNAFEDNDMRTRPVAMQQKMADTMEKRGMQMGVFVGHKIYWTEGNLTSGNLDKRAEFLEDIKKSVEVAKRVNAKWMTVVPGYVDLQLEESYQTVNVIESLKQAAAILEEENLTMVLEPLNFFNHPGLFLKESPQAYMICKAVDSPACKILFDIYHQQIQEGNLLPNIDACWDEIGYFQVGDNPGRKEPTTGEINYLNIFKHIHQKGYNGIIGMEHGNSIPGKAGEQAVIKAYLTCDNF